MTRKKFTPKQEIENELEEYEFRKISEKRTLFQKMNLISVM